MLAIIDQLNRKLQANLTPINHESLNHTFVGYSHLFHQSIFVKQFAKKQAYITEKNVTDQLNDRVLTGFSFDNTFVLVLKDWSPKDVSKPVDSKLAYEMGKILATFHLEVKPFPGIKIVKNQFDDYLAEINNFHKSVYKVSLTKLEDKFLPHKNEIQEELSNQSKYILHGDVGVRNYKYIDGKLTLIDFEKARLGPVYLDFIKLFYQDFALDNELINSFLRGYSTENADYQLFDLTKRYLIFTTAIGIFNYTEKIEDQPFKNIGIKMLETIDNC